MLNKFIKHVLRNNDRCNIYPSDVKTSIHDRQDVCNDEVPSTMVSGLMWLHRHNFMVNAVIDVGASNGSWSKECMKYFTNAKYILCEPQPVHFESLNSFRYSCEQDIVIVQKAIGQSDGKALFSAIDPYGGVVVTTSDNAYVIEVEMTTIDTIVSTLLDKGPYLIKLDTHGTEKSILNGACLALENTEILIVEAYNYRIMDDALLFWELCAFLAKKGFRPINIVDLMCREYDNSLWQMDIFFIKDTWKGFEHVSYK